MKLRAYQKNILDRIQAILEVHDSGLIILPTGGGKTIIFSSLIKKMKLKSLIVCNTREIYDQISNTLALLNIEDLADVVTIQSCRNKTLTQNYEMIVIDECHHIAANTYQRLLASHPNAKIIGVTATPFRSDKKNILKYFQGRTVSLSVFDLIKQGYLCEPQGYRFETNLKLPEPKKQDFDAVALTNVVNVKNRNELILKAYTSINPIPTQTIGFAASVTHATALAQLFNENGISADVINSRMKKGHRDFLINQFRAKQIHVLFNFSILTEGFDEPSLDCLLMCRPTISKTLYTQMIGRGLRIHPGKEHCKVLEFTDSHYDICDLRDLYNFPKDRVPYKVTNKEIHVFKPNGSVELFGDELTHKAFRVLHDPTRLPATQYQIDMLNNLSVKFDPKITSRDADDLIMSACEKSYGVY